MSHQYSSDVGDNPHRRQQSYSRPQSFPAQEQQYQYLAQEPSASQNPSSPSVHPNSQFNRLRAARRASRGAEVSRQQLGYEEVLNPANSPPPPPPPHRATQGRGSYRDSAHSNITPGVDNFGEQAAGGIAGIAMGVADTHARESGMDAIRNPPGYRSDEIPRQQGYNPDQVYSDAQPDAPSAGQMPRQTGYDQYPRGPPDALSPFAGGSSTGMTTPQSRSTGSRSLHSFNNEAYPNRYSRNFDPALALDFDPNSIEDDGDDGLEYRSNNNRLSMLSLGHSSRRSVTAAAAATGAGGAATSAGLMGALGGMAGRNASGGNTYDAVQNAPPAGSNNPALAAPQEKSEWLSEQSTGNKKMKWLIGLIVAFVIIGAIVGGVVGGLLSKKKSSGSSSDTQTASGDTASNGDLSLKSQEIQSLLNNDDLHKVFPGIDYTPVNTQYPDCLKSPPSQNNVTRDLAVLSQLTNTIRLYGTDCNQTQMLLHSIDQLKLNGTIKVWLGVWQDTNKTTNARQLKEMYDIFDHYGPSSFKGVIIGNEILFREDMSSTELGTLIADVKKNLTSKGIDLPIATSDLGDDWTQELADEVDYVMANIHPFFAGVTAEEAASWTYTFWTGHDTNLKSDISKNIISETGWPSTGGTDCGGPAKCDNGSVAGIDEMNTFMDTWVCQALANETNYFWFEAFDEPWKIKFNTADKNWEDKWGLMDVDRNLKPGVVIPDCGGKTVS